MNKQKHKTKSKSIVFDWNPHDFQASLKSCETDDEVLVALKHLKNKDSKILEAGCGIGRVVKYLHDKGFKNISGIEINNDIVQWLNKTHPKLDIVYADLLALPFEKNSFDVVLSYGVIEHFPDGPQAPLQAMFDVLKPGGLCVITIPSFNTLRRLSYFLSKLDPRKNNLVRKIFGKKPLHKNKKKYGYCIEPQIGNFFEYRFTKKQFESMCKQANFHIIESSPIAHIDGLFHSIFKPLITFKNWNFHMTPLGKTINNLLSKIPHFHNHMHACVVQKPFKTGQTKK